MQTTSLRSSSCDSWSLSSYLRPRHLTAADSLESARGEWRRSAGAANVRRRCDRRTPAAVDAAAAVTATQARTTSIACPCPAPSIDRPGRGRRCSTCGRRSGALLQRASEGGRKGAGEQRRRRRRRRRRQERSRNPSPGNWMTSLIRRNWRVGPVARSVGLPVGEAAGR